MNDFIFDLQLFDAESAAEDAEKEILNGAPEAMAESEIAEYTEGDTLNLEDTDEDGAKNVVVPENVAKVKFSSAGGSIAQFYADKTTSEKTVSFGANGDSAIIGSKGELVNAKINVNLGGGNDRVVNYGTNTFISLNNIANMTGTPMLYAGSGKTKMSINGTKAFALGVGIGLGVALSDLADSIKNLFSSMTNGIMTFTHGGAIDFNFKDDADTSSADKLADSDGNTVGTFDNATFSNTYTSDGTKIITGFTGNKGGTIDMSASDERFILYGNYNDDKLASVLKTGANDDNILAGSGDTVSAGAGTNTVNLTASRKEAANGAVIVASENSSTTVDEFSYGFDSQNDKINIDGFSDMSIAYNDDSTGIVFSNSDSKSKTTVNVGTTSTDSFRNVLIGDNSSATKATVVDKNASVNVTGASAYYGSSSVFDLSAYEGSAYIDLSNDGNSTLGESNVSLTGFNQLKAGAGNSTLYGSSAKETLTAGTGNGTIWGAGGNDSMVGVSSGKEGTTTFRFVAGDGRDTINGFDVANDTVYTENEIRSVSVNDKNVVIGLNSDDKLTIENVAGTDFTVKVNDEELKAQVGTTSLTYDGSATYYNAQGSNAKLTVSADAGKANVWLNQEVGANYGNTTQFFGEIVEIDGSRSSSSAVLVGSKDIDNKITASKGGSTLWGGGISNDTLIGGNGADSFYYMMGNGNDTIQNARANDQVVLNGIRMSQITSTNVSSGAVVLNFRDGGTLTLNTNNGTTFKLGDESGASYVTDKAGNWTKK